MSTNIQLNNPRPLITAAMLLGIGMGGFIDGILLHQILQVHSMLSAKLPQDVLVNVKVSMVWDGIFHGFTWLSTLAGIVLLWKAMPANKNGTGTMIWGGAMAGWGLFNLAEGLIDHHILGVHHVLEVAGLSIYDYLFLASGIVFIMAGCAFIKSGSKSAIETM